MIVCSAISAQQNTRTMETHTKDSRLRLSATPIPHSKNKGQPRAMSETHKQRTVVHDCLQRHFRTAKHKDDGNTHKGKSFTSVHNANSAQQKQRTTESDVRNAQT